MLRFVCEWCYEKIVVDGRSPRHVGVLAHLSSCPRRCEGMTLKQIAGLATHIAGLMVDERDAAKSDEKKQPDGRRSA